MSQKLPDVAFIWVETRSKFTKDFIKICNEDSGIGYFLKLMFHIEKNCMNIIRIYLLYWRE